MQVSDVRVKLINASAERLKAVCTVTFDGEFVVRDVKVVDGTNGMFVAMPSRKLSVHCPACKHKNHLRSRFCNECGAKVPPPRMQADDNGRSRLHRDIAHPITVGFRELVQRRVIEAFNAEVEKAAQPGYEPQPIEPEQDEEVSVERPAEFSEYDAMIASLRGSVPDERPERPDIRGGGQRDRGPAPDRGNSRQETSRDRQPQRRNQSERGDRTPPRRDSGRPEADRAVPINRGGDSNRSASGPRTEPPIRREQPVPPKPVVQEQPRREPVVSKPAASVPTRPARPEPKPQPVANTEPEDTGFGDGIL